MKQPVILPIWRHQEALKNRIEFYNAESKRLAEMQLAVDKMRAGIERLTAQIDSAIREGMEGFDPETYKPKKSR